MSTTASTAATLIRAGGKGDGARLGAGERAQGQKIPRAQPAEHRNSGEILRPRSDRKSVDCARQEESHASVRE
jgi:hypothetical protein